MRFRACAALVSVVSANMLMGPDWAPSAVAEDVETRSSTRSGFAADPLIQHGQSVYFEKCAACHGDQGQGVADAYADPLVGDDSIGELSKRISETMPDGEPEQCKGEDADAVAAYIYDAFYSEAARIRNRPPQITLTHLTGNQLRQSLADLYAHFSGAMPMESGRGLRGEYFDGTRARSSKRRIDRVDATIDFDWRADGPGEGITADDFCVQWRGGLRIDESGRYEFVIRSTCAFVCDLGRFGREFINNRVQSGDHTEFRRSIVLSAGRVYPIQIELYQRKRKVGQPPARISVSWVRPGGTEEVIPERHFLPSSPPATFSLQTKLPPDDRSYGYDRGLAIDRQWDDSTTAAAVEFAQAVVDELWPMYRRDHRKEPDEDRAILREFLREMAETAFRGPLDEAALQFYVQDQLAVSADDADAIKRSLLVILKSPRFLYPGLDQDRTPSERAANRLALTLFDSLPADEWLIRLAREGSLQTDAEIRSAAQRMVDDYRTRGKTRELMYAWLNFNHVESVTKNEGSFPGFDNDLVAELKASLDAFVDEVVWGESSDFRQLLLADWSYTTPRMAQYYGSDWEPSEESSGGLGKVAGKEHVGLLSHPFLMSHLAYQDSTSPIHRGVFLIRYLLGRTLRPPQEAFSPLSPDLHPNLTTRERVELQTSPQSCQVCHQKINGLGFALEEFDAVGRFREREGERPIDATGHYATTHGENVTFRGAAELAHFLAGSDDVHRTFVNRAFQHLVKQPIAAYGPDLLDELTREFRNDNFHIRKLLVNIAVIAAQPVNQPAASRLTTQEP